MKANCQKQRYLALRHAQPIDSFDYVSDDTACLKKKSHSAKLC